MGNMRLTIMLATWSALSLLVLISPTFSSPLDNLNINRYTISVSGFSSGGCFSTQFHTAFSASVRGMASLAGAPYVSVWDASDEEILEVTRSMASEGLIDSLENMRDDNIYIFQGLVDSITPWWQAARIEGFYQNFLSSDSIVENKDDIESEHGFPTIEPSQGGECSALNPPFYVNYCQYDGAANVLNKTIPGIQLSPPKTSKNENFQLIDFDQTEYFENNDAAHNGMDDSGFIFIPSSCSDGELPCHLHLHFHGCGMERGWLGDGYIQRTGFLPLAEANNIVMIFPQIRHSTLDPVNPSGCWDWWGYCGDSDSFLYATKQGKQMGGVARMVERAAGISML